MKTEYSCGAVLYRMENGTPRYVLVYDSHFGFPKGHIEPGETKEQTALREIYEETGLNAKLDTSFCERIEYDLVNKPGVRKEVTFFLAAYDPSEQPAPHNEIKRVCLVPYDDALALLWHEKLQTVLKKAHHVLWMRQKAAESSEPKNQTVGEAFNN